jgi:hypothetical protein
MEQVTYLCSPQSRPCKTAVSVSYAMCRGGPRGDMESAIDPWGRHGTKGSRTPWAVRRAMPGNYVPTVQPLLRQRRRELDP